MRKYCSKPILTLATDPYSLQGIIDMAAAQAGGYEQLKAKTDICALRGTDLPFAAF